MDRVLNDLVGVRECERKHKEKQKARRKRQEVPEQRKGPSSGRQGPLCRVSLAALDPASTTSL